jgi:hypothetical protein
VFDSSRRWALVKLEKLRPHEHGIAHEREVLWKAGSRRVHGAGTNYEHKHVGVAALIIVRDKTSHKNKRDLSHVIAVFSASTWFSVQFRWPFPHSTCLHQKHLLIRQDLETPSAHTIPKFRHLLVCWIREVVDTEYLKHVNAHYRDLLGRDVEGKQKYCFQKRQWFFFYLFFSWNG